MSFNLVILLLLGFPNVIFSSEKHKIFIGCLFPGRGVDYYGYKTAIELATEMINNRTDILPNHEIVMLCEDTYGSEVYTPRIVFRLIARPRNELIHMLIGPAWTRTTWVAYPVCVSFNIVELSYAATSAEFRDDSKYFGLYTNVPSRSAYNKARLSLIQKFGWKRIAILQEYNFKYYTQAVRDLLNQITHDSLNITLITIEGFSQLSKTPPKQQLENLQKLDARVIVGEFSTYGAVKVFCEAYKMGMVGPEYVWLLSGELAGDWFSPKIFHKYYHKTVDCNLRQIIEAADGFIASTQMPIRQDNNETISGLTSKTFMGHMRRTHNAPYRSTSYAFDSVWAAALLYQRSLSYPDYRPENVKFRSRDVREQYASFLSETQFEGLSGLHHFDKRQRLGNVRIIQMRNISGKAKLFQVGTFTSINRVESKITLLESQINKLWKDGKVPVDETTKERNILTYSIGQLSVIGAFAIFGLLYSIFFLYFNVSKRNHKVIRMSSPMINNVVLLGCFFCYTFVLLLGIDSRFVDDHVFGILCNVRLYVLAIAFSLAFGALFSKTWRVHKIFTAKIAIKKKLMRDFHLILFVLVLVMIDVTFITIWVLCDPLEMEEIIFDELKEYSRDLITIPVLKICDCTHRTKLLGALYGYKGIILLFGVVLAWETRNVKIPALNDSKYIGISVYNVVILSAIGATVSTVLKKTVHYELLHALVSIIVLLSTTVTLTMMFAPKVYLYYTIPPEPERRVRDMNSLQMHVGSRKETEVADVSSGDADVKDKWTQTEECYHVSNIIGDAHPKVNGGLFGDNRGEQVLEGERQKHEDNKVGPMENIAFQEHNN